ncbi:hypothetical protein [Sinomicrobium weinanense]|uniref:T9SS C-terminal target domain-containing protein n=1 Tax=Sinomicrobium weinanense TaxID=2842200 RepID=A0A926JTE7_9FLAO|nr:hypothetical protein [Sinomicrobium weinanense]MBC9797192.1 hypothetical protein [Sinomicrobium weinanense]MBU3122744.1 hypothetical protein [Sinomicrobium weinanense]
MKTRFSLLAMSVAVLLTSCSKEDPIEESDPTLNAEFATLSVGVDNRSWPSATGTISGLINTNTTLTNDKVWFIDGPTYVANGVTLTVEKNTLVKWKTEPTSGSASYLLVEKGGRLVADGENPAESIVFTSDQAKGNRAAGDWGGIILLGDAPTNQPNTEEIEGILDEDIPNGVSITFGGSNPGHNAGTLRYVRIEYAGRDLGGGNEINGLTLGGVGHGTTLENIQVSFGKDDGFEFFGGTVNAKNLIAFGNADDDFDFDFGYSGQIQFAVAKKVPGVVFSGDPNGIECDNDGNGSSRNPITRPVLSNVTILGMETGGAATPLLNGNHWRRNTSFVFRNSIIAGYDTGVHFNGTDGKLGSGGTAEFRNNLVHAFTTPVSPSSATGEPNYMDNTTNTGNSNFMNLTDPYNTSSPDYGLASPFPAFGTSYAGLSSFFVPVDYKGAFGASASGRWDDNWASYQPNNNPY